MGSWGNWMEEHYRLQAPSDVHEAHDFEVYQRWMLPVDCVYNQIMTEDRVTMDIVLTC